MQLAGVLPCYLVTMCACAAPVELSSIEEEFDMKIKYNFKTHVSLHLKGTDRRKCYILNQVFSLRGYRCHKVTKLGTQWSHLHVKFSEEQQAKEAVDIFTENSDVTAMLVDDMLRVCYTHEMMSNYNQRGTLTTVDVVGSTPRSLNFLTKDLLNYIFEEFGQPHLLYYTASLAETRVYVLFSSMTAALAACMAFGEWYEMNSKTDRFVYRVRISPSEKEDLLVKSSEEIFESVLHFRPPVKKSSSRRRLGNQQKKVPKTCKSNESRRTQKICLLKSYFLDKMVTPQTNFPILFFPFMVPLSTSSIQSLLRQ